MKTVAAEEFKTHCFRLIDEVTQRREAMTITRNGIPVARLVPVEDISVDVIGCLEGVMEIVGDIESPMVPADAWGVAGPTGGSGTAAP